MFGSCRLIWLKQLTGLQFGIDSLTRIWASQGLEDQIQLGPGLSTGAGPGQAPAGQPSSPPAAAPAPQTSLAFQVQLIFLGLPASAHVLSPYSLISLRFITASSCGAVSSCGTVCSGGWWDAADLCPLPASAERLQQIAHGLDSGL